MTLLLEVVFQLTQVKNTNPDRGLCTGPSSHSLLDLISSLLYLFSPILALSSSAFSSGNTKAPDIFQLQFLNLLLSPSWIVTLLNISSTSDLLPSA